MNPNETEMSGSTESSSGVSNSALVNDKLRPYMIVEVGMRIPMDMEGHITKRGIARKEVELLYAKWDLSKTYGI